MDYVIFYVKQYFLQNWVKLTLHTHLRGKFYERFTFCVG